MRTKETAQLLAGIQAFEQTFKCHVSIHDYSGQLREEIHRLPFYHLNSLCTALKYKSSTLTATCFAFDRNAVQQRLAKRPTAFLKYCHCRLLEVVIPIFISGKLSGAMFIGQFRWYNELLPPDVLYSGAKTVKLDTVAKSLPVIDCAIAKRIIGLGELICANIGITISQLPQSSVTATGSRREKITAFIEERFKDNISLTDLAVALILSESRTSQLIKELFKMNFPELLTQRRLEQAQSLLENSMFTIATIADYSGFRDVAYFHRVFRKYYKMAPGQYRKHITNT